jgi:DNA polymerase III epsilon subunit-like protein
MAGLDFETTGVDPETARIVTACVPQVGGGQPAAVASWLSDVGGEDIPAQASAVHGVTTERARTEGAPAAEVVESVVAALVQVAAHDLPVVVMNARYDVTVLDREARRYGVAPLSERVDRLHVVDPLVLDKKVDQFRPGKRTLTALCEHYRVPLGAAHTADADAVAACRVAWRLASLYPELAAMDLPELHAAQVFWAADQAASLQAHFRRRDPQAVVEPAWPLVPVSEAVAS